MVGIHPSKLWWMGDGAQDIATYQHDIVSSGGWSTSRSHLGLDLSESSRSRSQEDLTSRKNTRWSRMCVCAMCVYIYIYWYITGIISQNTCMCLYCWYLYLYLYDFAKICMWLYVYICMHVRICLYLHVPVCIAMYFYDPSLTKGTENTILCHTLACEDTMTWREKVPDGTQRSDTASQLE